MQIKITFSAAIYKTSLIWLFVFQRNTVSFVLHGRRAFRIYEFCLKYC